MRISALALTAAMAGVAFDSASANVIMKDGKTFVSSERYEVRPVQDASGYNSWQMIQALGGRLV